VVWNTGVEDPPEGFVTDVFEYLKRLQAEPIIAFNEAHLSGMGRI